MRPAPSPRRRAGTVAREKAVVALMVALHCRGAHRGRHAEAGAVPCPDCAALTAYAHARLDACRHGDAKPACRRCATHCYRPDMRERIRAAMRYAGPRMPFLAPLAFLRHAFGSRGRSAR